MNLGAQLEQAFPDHFRVLILDNEVTVDAFVATPPLPWARLVAAKGAYQIGDGYPRTLSAIEAEHEELNWDKVALGPLSGALAELDGSVDLIALGNNAGQGLPLALSVPEAFRADHGVIVYGASLPEWPAYEQAGYRRFCPRNGLIALISDLANGRAVARGFINTIEHNEQNYHTPWTERGSA